MHAVTVLSVCRQPLLILAGLSAGISRGARGPACLSFWFRVCAPPADQPRKRWLAFRESRRHFIFRSGRRPPEESSEKSWLPEFVHPSVSPTSHGVNDQRASGQLVRIPSQNRELTISTIGATSDKIRLSGTKSRSRPACLGCRVAIMPIPREGYGFRPTPPRPQRP
jgi:hypothetical protein